MSRVYKCKKCHGTHSPPTGRKCTKHPDFNATPVAASDPVPGALDDINKTLFHIQQRLEALEQKKSGVQDSDESSTESESVGGDIGLPSTKTLRKDGTLQSKVADRLSKLKSLSHLLRSDDDDSESDSEIPTGKEKRKGKKSGRLVTADHIIVKRVDWPHFHVYRGADRSPASYKDLTIQEFVYGFLCSLEETKRQTSKEHMLCHLKELMEDAIQYGWPSVRNYHGILLHQFELNKITWMDTAEIQKLRRRYVHQPVPFNRVPKGPLFCLSFQEHKCTQAKDHDSSRGFVKHICAYCLKNNGKEHRHAESDCRQKATAAKNDDLEKAA